jgi:hypothetical protein
MFQKLFRRAHLAALAAHAARDAWYENPVGACLVGAGLIGAGLIGACACSSLSKGWGDAFSSLKQA